MSSITPMIKRFRFVNRRSDVSADDFAATWPERVRAQRGPAEVRPMRTVACTLLRDVEAAPHDALTVEWFESSSALRRFERWMERASHDVDVVGEDAVFVAQERVMRGADWLEQRWSRADVKVKHMALARRADGLSAAELAERWRQHAGNVGAKPIPDAAKGLAYVQNYPADGIEPRGRYDVINEVYFDDLEAMRSRIAFFRSIDAPTAASDLVSEVTFVAVTEHVV